MNQPIKIIIIDDHRLFNDGVKTILSNFSNVEVVKQITDASTAVSEVFLCCPDVVLMDYNMPNLNGLKATKILLENFENLKIIFISMFEDIQLVEKFYQSGAYGYVPKTATKETFIEAIEMVMGGYKYFPNSLFEAKKETIFNGVKITKRESEILEKVKEGFTTKQIAEALNISYYTAETHRKNIIVKLGLRGEQELYKYLNKV